MGKRRLTDHWRRFIHPLMWRCKWLEVKLHDFKSQALKYDRELAKYSQSEQFEFGNVTSQGFDAELQAFPSKIQKKEVMKRKKRKRVEDTADVASYMSDHNIFSYYDNKTINGYDDGGGWPIFKSRDGDKWSEQILRNIEVLRSRIQKLKTRMGKLMTESPQKFSSINMLSSAVPCDVVNNSGNQLYPDKGDGNSSHCTTSQHESECDMRDNFMPGSAVSSHGVVAPFPDMIRSMSRRLLEISSENIEGEILIPNEAAKEELCNFGSAISQQAEKPHISRRS
ncbi:uncharacterized protein LOC110415788 isoform X2 [Herrania umbratica]|uniref:Uncharacterized protein LOC110415788 isoform X2 n=1 Tax=Herrania umbratica TaxID=108875 RepID=A0A6J1A8Z7_9ROSI|nr:uncharacterized protein LOC110415788 isoform X2 [Herrania umbratica]